MQNPFKVSLIRKSDLEQIKNYLLKENRLVLILPRRFGKPALVAKALGQLGRPFICVNLQQTASALDIAECLLAALLRLYPFENIRVFLSERGVSPAITFSTSDESAVVSFPAGSDGFKVLGDIFSLIEKVSAENRLTVVFDEIEELAGIEKDGFSKSYEVLRTHDKINFVFTGTKEEAVSSIFSNDRSAFYNFGCSVERLTPVPYEEFFAYLAVGLKPVFSDASLDLAEEILTFTSCRTFFAQQLASAVWDLGKKDNVLEQAVKAVTAVHDFDFERVWCSFNRTDRLVMKLLAKGLLLSENKDCKTSTLYSSAGKLAKLGYLVHTPKLEIEDPFFKRWILSQSAVTFSVH